MIIETPRGTETKYENRVVTNGVTHQGLEVFYTGHVDQGGRGYGVWCRNAIEQGTFLTTYVGEILTIPGEWTVDLAHLAISKRTNSVHLDFVIMIGAEANAQSDTSYQLVLQIESKVHDSELESSPAVRHAWPAAEYVIDAKKKGNISRFLNHDGASPNVFAQMGALHDRSI
eukprot:COSAG02_NODE_849_length_16548_cov_6.418384_11_plen_172_part_00